MCFLFFTLITTGSVACFFIDKYVLKVDMAVHCDPLKTIAHRVLWMGWGTLLAFTVMKLSQMIPLAS